MEYRATVRWYIICERATGDDDSGGGGSDSTSWSRDPCGPPMPTFTQMGVNVYMAIPKHCTSGDGELWMTGFFFVLLLVISIHLPCKLMVHVVLLPRSNTTTLVAAIVTHCYTDRKAQQL